MFLVFRGVNWEGYSLDQVKSFDNLEDARRYADETVDYCAVLDTETLTQVYTNYEEEDFGN